MSDTKNEKETSTEGSSVKPTITIAERKDEETQSAAKPTITIAERKDGDE